MNDVPPQETPEPSDDDQPLDPEKLLRLASLVRAVSEETRAMDPKAAPAPELASLHKRITTQLREALPKTLVEELDAINLSESLDDGATGEEVRIAFSGLVGWLQGLFQGLQAAMQWQSLTSEAEQLESGKDKDEKPGRYL